MELAIAGAPTVRPEIKFDPIRSIEHHRSNIVTGQSFKNKSWLQRLFEQLIATVNQKGNPNA
ncbi:hypothetical protein [Symbiopectobacterium purcellii]|uniref:Uncharacterized protein n=1 Tax=Symbiopectobacterium purcellii TaxID=2871826 RepID=A0ABX9AMJ9_9ENTR|nr:hypothetical protein [Symbiopectobacterium purcellii]QZN96407.1 hypothetical protein K6K13_02760 [Symbiopectobacterium purcellii]